MSRNSWKKEHKGLTLRSGFEQRVAKYLDKKKIKYEYETVKLEYTAPETKHSYTPDFIIDRGKKLGKLFVEVKGRWTAQDRKKMVQVKECNPDKDIRIIFMIDNPITKKSKTTYTMWAEKRGIPCHVDREGALPDSWITGEEEE